MTKRFLTAALIAALLLTSCHAYAEDEDIVPSPALLQALHEAGRENGSILACDICRNGDTPEAAAFLVQAGDVAQLTLLEAAEDGSWLITGQNDTIPASIMTEARLILLDGPPSPYTHAGRDWLRLETQKYIPSTSDGARIEIGYFMLDFQRSPGGGWVLRLACDIPFEEAKEGRCPYHLLHFTDGLWKYKFYEMITDDTGSWSRSEVILQETVPAEELAPYAELKGFDYSSFLSYLRSLAPEDYEHAPGYGTPTVPPPAAPDPDDPAGKAADVVYHNPYGGRYYHADRECPSVNPKYLPLTEISINAVSGERLNLLPCPRCVTPDRQTPSPLPAFSSAPSPAPTDAPEGTNAEKSILKAAAPSYGDNGLTSLLILMDTPERQAYILESFPPYCYLDPDHEGGVIRIVWFPEMIDRQDTPREPCGERWAMTFEFKENTWRLTNVTNGRDWTANADHGVYTFDDCNDPGGNRQWSAEFGDSLTEFDYAGLAKLIDLYNAAMPSGPSLR